MALRTRIEDTCDGCGGSWLVVEHRTRPDQQWREVRRSCLRRCHVDDDALEQAS